MTTDNPDLLASLITNEREAILTRWRQQVRELPSAEKLDTPTLNDHIPDLLEELVKALQSKCDQSIQEALNAGSSPDHGRQRVQDSFDIVEVVAEYNLLRGCLHDLAEDNGINLQGKPFHIINQVFDSAIGLAVQAYATQQALDVQRRREEYLAFVAHDLRTPLNAISLAGRVLEGSIGKGEVSHATSQMLHSLRRNVQQLEGMVARVLEENENLQTEMGIKLERRRFDLWPLVEALIHNLYPVAGTASTQMVNKVPEDMVVYADASLVKRIFQNLIGNAIRYTPRGTIMIEARKLEGQGGVECRVTDTGTGIPQELLERVFERGETDQATEGGMGLGLAIVKTFTEAHGGQVTVESRTGGGTTFCFSLPAE